MNPFARGPWVDAVFAARVSTMRARVSAGAAMMLSNTGTSRRAIFDFNLCSPMSTASAMVPRVPSARISSGLCPVRQFYGHGWERGICCDTGRRSSETKGVDAGWLVRWRRDGANCDYAGGDFLAPQGSLSCLCRSCYDPSVMADIVGLLIAERDRIDRAIAAL